MLASTSPVLTTPGLPQDAASVAEAEMGATIQSPATSTPGTKTTALRGIAHNLAGRGNIGGPFSNEFYRNFNEQLVTKRTQERVSGSALERVGTRPAHWRSLGGRSWL